MKRLILIMLIGIMLININVFAQEGFNTKWLRTKGGNIEWVLPDTSEVFPLYYYNTWKGLFNDTSGTVNDSCSYIVYLYTSSVSATFDSTFTLAQTIFNAPNELDGDSTIAYHGGYTRAKSIFVTPERFGAIIIRVLSDGAQVDSSIVGRCYINGWTNQQGAILTKWRK